MKTKNLLFTLALSLLTLSTVFSQTVSTYTFSQSVGTYTPIVGGTVFLNASSPSMDDVISGAITIPSFTYAGTAYTSMRISSNGFVTFGTTAPGTTNYTPISNNTAYAGAIAAFGRDLNQSPSGTPEISYLQVGSEFVIQWQDVTRYGDGEDFSFQIRLNTSTNAINVVYGNNVVPVVTDAYPQVGLRGPNNTFATNVNNRKAIATTGAWVNSVPGTVNSSTCYFDIATPGTVPATGTTFTWLPPAGSPIDMSATGLVSPGTSGCYGANQTVTVSIKNNGTALIDFAVNPVTVNCSVTGTNPIVFTPIVLNSGTLASNASQNVVISATYGMILSGAYTFNANTTVTGDGNTANDAMTSVVLNVSRVNTFPHIVGFDVIPNPAFFVQQVAGTGNWALQTTGNLTNPALAPVLNPGFAYFNSYNFASGTTSRLITPCYDMSTLVAPAIDIWMSQDNAYPTDDERINVIVSTDGGVTYSAPLQTLHRYLASSAGQWTKFTVPLNAYAGNSSVKIALEAISVFGDNMALDQVKVYDVPPIDAGATALVSPVTNSCHSANQTVTVTVQNFGGSTLNFATTPLTVNVAVTGASTQNFSFVVNTGTLAPTATQNVTVTTACNLTAVGTHNFACSTSITGDGDPTNNTFNTSVSVGDISIIPHTQNFTAPVLGWDIQQVSGTGNWTYLTGSMINPSLSPNSAPTMVYFNSYSFAGGTVSRLSSPCINFTGINNPSVDFYMTQDVAYPTDDDRVEVRVSTDGGATYGPVVYTAHRYNTAYSTAGWKKFSVCLSAFANMTNIKIAFDGVSVFGDNIGLDDVSLHDSPPAVAGTASATSTTLCAGDSTQLTLAGTTGTIQWQSSPNGITYTDITGQTNPTLNSGPLLTSVYYRAFVTNADACARIDSSNAIHVIVNPRPVVSLGVDQTQCAGTILLDAQNGGSSYLWSNAATTQTISVSATGSYNVVVTNGFGCTKSDTINITINPLPVVSLGTDVTQCAGTVLLDAQNAGSAYVWSDASTTQTITVGTTGTYSVVVTDLNGCSNSDAILVTINALPIVNLGVDQTQCGGTILLDAQNAGSAYVWSDASTTQTIAVSTTGTYSVTVTDVNGCSSNDAIDITINPVPVVSLGADVAQCIGTVTLDAGNPGDTYIWSNAATTQTTVVSTTGNYSVIVTNSFGCTNTDDINVTINPLPVVNLGADVIQCGGTVLLDALNPGSNYFWSTTATTQQITVSNSATYTVQVTDVNGCSNADTVMVTINAVPVQALGADITQCGGTATLDAQNAGSTYLWSNAATTQTIVASTSGTYMVTITSVLGCTNADTITVTINPVPAPSLGPDTTICIGNSVTLVAPPNFSAYLWRWNQVQSNQQFITVAPNVTTIYTLTVTNTFGCTGSDTITVNVDPLPNASFTFVNVNGSTFNFTNTSTGSTPMTVTWNFGDGSPLDNTSNPTHVYTANGTYSVILTIQTPCGFDQVIVQVTVTGVGIDEVFANGSITVYPNPTNGAITIEMENILTDELNISISDVQGKVIYTSSDKNTSKEFTKQIDLSGFANGVYSIRFNSGDALKVERLIIAK